MRQKEIMENINLISKMPELLEIMFMRFKSFLGNLKEDDKKKSAELLISKFEKQNNIIKNIINNKL